MESEIYTAAAPTTPEAAAAKVKAMIDGKLSKAPQDWQDKFWAALQALISAP